MLIKLNLRLCYIIAFNRQTSDTTMPDQIPPQEKKIVVWVPFLKTTMEINERDFNPGWMVKPKAK